LLCRDYKGKEADRLVARIDPGVVSLVAELHGHERQALEELEQWRTHHEERKPLDASPAAVTLALLLTDEDLDSLEKSAGDGEIARGGRPGGSDEPRLEPAARHGEPTQVFPGNAAPPERRPRLDGVICGSRSRAVAKECDARSISNRRRRSAPARISAQNQPGEYRDALGFGKVSARLLAPTAG